MSIRTSTCMFALVAACALGWSPAVHAQSRTLIESSPGRIHCYAHANGAGFERRSSIRLCRGAMSDVPARCAVEVRDRVRLSDERTIRLCRAATSMAPSTCAYRLGRIARGIVGVCAALPWPLIAAKSPGLPECVRIADVREGLAEHEAVRLCRGTTSLAPVECFDIGDQATRLDDRELVDLCVPVIVSAPTVIPPARPRR